MKLGYYNDDYLSIGGASSFTQRAYTSPSSLEASGNQLFNGNISYSTLSLSKIGVGVTTGYTYGYDQLNRLVEMRQHTASGSWSNSDIITAYRESIAYDANGNILKYLRKGTAATPDMDSLSYQYNRDGAGYLVNNKLDHIRDAIGRGNYTVDIDNQSAGNYGYDKIGNLIRDNVEGLDSVRWTVYGKINRIKKSGGAFLNYGYDPGGNRTFKQFSNGSSINNTYYVRDAQGNVLAIYEKAGSDAIKWSEQHLYGSSRLGMWKWDTVITALGNTPFYDSLLFGARSYELSNHLGNVLATISDKKIGNDSSGVVNYYLAEALSQNDYYPFGMLQPGRRYGVLGRYGFNGKENDNEVKGEGGQQDYGMRIYDPRVGRFLSVDPLIEEYPMLTPYQFASNTPIQAIDLDGAEGERRIGGDVRDLYSILIDRGVNHKEAMKAVDARSRGGAFGVAAGLALAPGTFFGGPIISTGRGSWAVRPLLTNMFKAGLVGAGVNATFSYAKGDDGYEIAKSATSGFFSGAIMGMPWAKTLQGVLVSGGISGSVGEFVNQYFDNIYGNDKGYSLRRTLISGGIGSVSSFLSNQIVNKINSLLDTKLTESILQTETDAYRENIKKSIIQETPRIGSNQLKKAINTEIRKIQTLLRKQTEMSKAAAKQAIERGVDYLQDQTNQVLRTTDQNKH